MTPKQDLEDPVILKIYEHLIRETKRRGIIAGLHNNNPSYAARMVKLGFRLVTIQNDAGLLAKAAREAFLSSASGAAVPVVAIDGVPIGDGKPGPVARRIRELYARKAGIEG